MNHELIIFIVFIFVCLAIVIGDQIEKRRLKRESYSAVYSPRATQTLACWEAEHNPIAGTDTRIDKREFVLVSAIYRHDKNPNPTPEVFIKCVSLDEDGPFYKGLDAYQQEEPETASEFAERWRDEKPIAIGDAVINPASFFV